jgi:hypothetical protein
MATQTSNAGDTIGTMYSHWVLDLLMESAYAVSNDFVARPQLYQTVDQPVVEKLVQIRVNYGSDAHFPSSQQRQQMNLPIFGRSDALRPDTSALAGFVLARKKLLDAATAFAERSVDTGVQMLTDRIRSALVPLRSYLQSVFGTSMEASNKQIDSFFEQAVDILRSGQVSAVFGFKPARADWPEASDDPNGAKLVGAISSTLKLSPDYSISWDKFILLRRVAAEGRKALKKIYDTADSEMDLSDLITATYTWGTSIRDYQS